MKRLFRKFWLLLVCCILLLNIAAAAPQVVDTTIIPVAVSLILPIIIGRLAVPLINWLKKDVLKWTKDTDTKKNVWLALGVSFAMAILTLLITGSFVPYNGDPMILSTWCTLTFTVATVVYKGIQDAEQVPPPVPE